MASSENAGLFQRCVYPEPASLNEGNHSPFTLDSALPKMLDPEIHLKASNTLLRDVSAAESPAPELDAVRGVESEAVRY